MSIFNAIFGGNVSVEEAIEDIEETLLEVGEEEAVDFTSAFDEEALYVSRVADVEEMESNENIVDADEAKEIVEELKGWAKWF